MSPLRLCTCLPQGHFPSQKSDLLGSNFAAISAVRRGVPVALVTNVNLQPGPAVPSLVTLPQPARRHPTSRPPSQQAHIGSWPLGPCSPRVLRHSIQKWEGVALHLILSPWRLQATPGLGWEGTGSTRRREAAAANAPSSSWMTERAGPAIKINPQTALK